MESSVRGDADRMLRYGICQPRHTLVPLNEPIQAPVWLAGELAHYETIERV